MKLIIDMRTLRAHNVIKASRDPRPEFTGIAFRNGKIMSTDGKICLLTTDLINPATPDLVIVKVERVPAGDKLTTAVIDTETRLCYFLHERVVHPAALIDLDLNTRRVSVCGASIINGAYPNIEAMGEVKASKISNIKLGTPILERLHKVARVIGLKSGNAAVELTFQGNRGEAVAATMKAGSAVFNIYFKPMI